jgi:16S rRNA (cytosine1402-N4)-methyltransferase
VLDCTLGMGGHAAAVLAAGATVVGIDRDPQARNLATGRLSEFSGRFAVRAGTFAEVVEDCVRNGERFDGVLADLGVSSLQLDDHGRGFSIRSEVRPDMRMGDDAEDALDLIDRLDEAGLADIIYQYGEERLSRRIARSIKRARAEGAVNTAAELAAVVRRAVPGHQPRHPALRTFQALRIAVNDELGQLDRLLAALPELLTPGGRAVLISFHSLEDRRVKLALRDHRGAGRISDAAKHPIIASDTESAANPRSASAKLRWAVR